MRPVAPLVHPVHWHVPPSMWRRRRPLWLDLVASDFKFAPSSNPTFPPPFGASAALCASASAERFGYLRRHWLDSGGFGRPSAAAISLGPDAAALAAHDSAA